MEISENETYPLPLTSIVSHRARLSSYFKEKVGEESIWKLQRTIHHQPTQIVNNNLLSHSCEFLWFLLQKHHFHGTCSLVLWQGSFAVTWAQQMEPMILNFILVKYSDRWEFYKRIPRPVLNNLWKKKLFLVLKKKHSRICQIEYIIALQMFTVNIYQSISLALATCYISFTKCV